MQKVIVCLGIMDTAKEMQINRYAVAGFPYRPL